ncbi:glutamine amidotransferase subunit [Cystobasidiomycetes sp. EMM_F5]
MGVVSEPNCHPWSLGSLMFMHNGEVANFNAIKRKLQAALDDRFFNLPGGGTDSEWCFSLFLQKLSKLADVDAPCFPFRILQQAVLETISTLNAWAAEAGTTEPSLLNFCVTDGHTIIATRYISSRTDEAASLWFSTGSSFEQYKSGGYYRMRKNDKRENIVLIASEPLTFEKADWLEIPCQTCVVVTNRMNVLQIPIVDEFSQTTPSPRNQFFATAKGYEFSKPIVKPVPQAVVIPVSPTATVVVQTSANPTTKPADIAAAATAS